MTAKSPQPVHWPRDGRTTTRTAPERAAYQAGRIVGVEQALAVVDPLITLWAALLVLLPDDAELDQTLTLVEAGIRHLREAT